MALLDRSKYSSLSESSDNNSGGAPGIFSKVFICGEPRAGQKVGQLYAFKDNKADKIDEKYLIHDAEEIFFLPMFIKRVRERQIDDPRGAKDPRRKDSKIITYFSWEPEKDTNPPADAKCVNIIAGALFTKELKPVFDAKDPSRAAFIHFRCDGVKMGSYINYMNLLSEKAAKLEPLSDDRNFEKNVVLPRRFITRASVTIAETGHGNKYIFLFEPFKQLPDAAIVGSEGKEGVMDRCIKWQATFKEQFDWTGRVKTGNFAADTNYPIPTNTSLPTFEDGVKAQANTTIAKADFDIGV